MQTDYRLARFQARSIPFEKRGFKPGVELLVGLYCRLRAGHNAFFLRKDPGRRNMPFRNEELGSQVA